MWRKQEEEIKARVSAGELDPSALEDMPLPSIPYVCFTSSFIYSKLTSYSTVQMPSNND